MMKVSTVTYGRLGLQKYLSYLMNFNSLPLSSNIQNLTLNQIKAFLITTLLGLTVNLPGQTISLDLDQSYQTIEGWENGAFIPPGIEPYIVEDVVNLAVDTLGLNRLRLEIRSGTEYSANNYQMYLDTVIDYDTWRSLRYATVNDNSDPFTIDWSGFHFTEFDEKIEKIIVPFRDQLIKNGSNLYINLCFVAFTDQLNGGAGGAIIHQDPEEYAELIQATFLHMDSKYGFVPDGVEVILEPNVASFGSGTLVGECLVAAGQRLEEIGFNPDFIACSNTNLNGALNYYSSFIAVPHVSNYWTEYSFHAYAGRTDANLVQVAANASASGVNTSMLEWWANGNTYSYLHDCLRLANVSTYQFKGSFGAPDNSWNSGLLQIVTQGNNSYNLALQPPSKYLRHYFRLIMPGAIRYDATSSDANYDAVAFINPNGNLLLNIDAATEGTVRILGLPAGSYYTIHSLGNGKEEPNPYWQKSSMFDIASEEPLDLNIEGGGVYSIVQHASPTTSITSQPGKETEQYQVRVDSGVLEVSASGPNQIKSISIYSSTGENIMSRSYTNSSLVNIDYSKIAKGVYIVMVNNCCTQKVFLW